MPAGPLDGDRPADDYDSGCIQRIDPKTGDTRVLYTHCNGHKLSAPNDLVPRRAATSPISQALRATGGLCYALPDDRRSSVYPILSPSGCGLSPDGKVLPSPPNLHGCGHSTSPRRASSPSQAGLRRVARIVAGLGSFQRFDSLAVEASGNVAVATLHAGCITVIAPDGKVVRQVTVPDEFPTNICFGGPDLRTAYVTLSATGRLGALDWGEPGLRLNF
jgi:gluconolactonase